ncbi:hypothetical protein AB0I49_04880 [Streptomyces sp. NPDC050617]|uniref:hypothetical protein n=1 Tax=Streptomyces sp. NPDC050617 TaxID=3154628 RepID=UPI0034125F9A
MTGHGVVQQEEVPADGGRHGAGPGRRTRAAVLVLVLVLVLGSCRDRRSRRAR